MKTQITKLMAAAMLLAASFTANATDNASERSLKVSAKNSKAVVLQLGDLPAGTNITIWNAEGELLFRDNTNNTEYARVFNLKSLEEGEIYLEIESAGQLEILPIEVTSSSAKIKRSAEVIIEKPVVKQSEGAAKVFFGQNNADMKVTLFDASNDIVYRHTVADGTGSKTYDLSKLEDGTYKFQFSANGRTFFHTVILN
ncbi:MAG: hypothetical protein HEP71_00590 [Roseivirga sp.]|nr:hypothetical protein [Roseivirga sp.]